MILDQAKPEFPDSYPQLKRAPSPLLPVQFFSLWEQASPSAHSAHPPRSLPAPGHSLSARTPGTRRCGAPPPARPNAALPRDPPGRRGRAPGAVVLAGAVPGAVPRARGRASPSARSSASAGTGAAPASSMLAVPEPARHSRTRRAAMMVKERDGAGGGGGGTW